MEKQSGVINIDLNAWPPPQVRGEVFTVIIDGGEIKTGWELNYGNMLHPIGFFVQTVEAFSKGYPVMNNNVQGTDYNSMYSDATLDLRARIISVKKKRW